MSNSFDSQSPWMLRVKSANKYYANWESHFRCNILEQYYRGNQWKSKKDMLTVNYHPYTLNLFNSTIKQKLALFLFQKPSFIITPTPGSSQWNVQDAVESAYIKQDALNSIVGNPSVNFVKNIKRAAKDSFVRFGMVEVGYAADWRNPQKTPALLNTWDDADVASDKIKNLEDIEVPVNERVYFKRINPKRFRVGVSDASDLNDCEWCGYYDYVYTDVLRKTKGIKFPKGYSETLMSADLTSGVLGEANESRPPFMTFSTSNVNISKVWNIWDLVSRRRLYFLDQTMDEPMWEEEIEDHPFIECRGDEDFEGWYPIPPAFQWISPQDEINEAREQTRSYRRRFTRKFQAVRSTVDPLEIEKFTAGPDGVVIEVNQKDAITAIDNPEIGPTSENALLLAKDDFNVISGTSAEARGQSSDRETATQAKIMDARAAIRESAEQIDFVAFLEEIARKALKTMAEDMTEDMWVKDSTSDFTGSDIGQVMQVKGPLYKRISVEQFKDGYDIEIIVDVQNMTPQAQVAQQQSFVQFLTLVHNFPEIALSPDLIREAAVRSGYRNERVIRAMQQTALMNMAAQAAGMTGGGSQNAGSGTNANNIAAARIQQMSPGTEVQQQRQLDQQFQ